MVEIKNLTVKYKNSETDAVRGVSFTLEKGSFSALVGESGSGKSTIISAALGLLPQGTFVSGEILYRGVNILGAQESELRKYRWKELALVPQGALNSFTPVLTIGRHIEEVLAAHLKISGKEASEKITELLEETGLPKETAKKYPHELSGGQKQRAAIALALACSPSMLFADEPTTALDVVTQAGILKLLMRLCAEKSLTILLVTHDLPMAASICGKLLVMKDGALIETGTPRQIIENPQAEHTKALVRAILRG